MQPVFDEPSWADCLRRIAPIRGLVHVGAGRDQLRRCYRPWSVPEAIFIEANDDVANGLEEEASGMEGWRIHRAIVAEVTGQRVFYEASNPRESGLLPPEKLAGLWKNLKATNETERSVTTIRTLLDELRPSVHAINWLVIDCLPAASILQRFGTDLERLDVIGARVVIDDSVADSGTSWVEFDGALTEQGYRCVAVKRERHPGLGMAYYVRDLRCDLARLAVAYQAEATQSERLLRDKEQQIERLERANAALEIERNVLTQQNDELAKKVQGMERDLDECGRLAQERQTAGEQLAEALEEESRRVLEREGEVERLRRANAELEQEKTGLIEQVDELTKVVEVLTLAREDQANLAMQRQAEIDQLAQARDEQSRIAEERQVRISQLEAHLDEAELRQRLLSEEVVKAEAQIDLIKDVLLQDPSL